MADRRRRPARPGVGLRSRMLASSLASLLPALRLAAALILWGGQRERAAGERGMLDTNRALAVERQIRGWEAALQALPEASALRASDFAALHPTARAGPTSTTGGSSSSPQTVRS